ncbi:MAG: DUF1961 family protein [Planctomycetes bacterium]|nr:DUF1961 family protein [Planctomycetota bacterium]
MKQLHSASTIALVLLLPAIVEAQQTVPPHELVGKRFVPSDIDFGRPVYEALFDDPDELGDWKLEGGDVARVTDDGDLLLKSEKHQVFWLAKQIPADFLLEFTVRPHDRKQGLNIVFFNTTGLSGENIFKSPIKPRDGSFKQYWDGDLKSYHVSYWAGAGANAGTRGGQANLRKNKGKTLIASGNDLITGGETGTFQTVRIYKRGGTIRVMVDDVVAVACDDDKPLDLPGWIGFRQMGHTLSCRYGHVKVWPLRKLDATVRANLFPSSGDTILNENQRRLTHEIKLTKPGHYILRARAKSDAIVAQMSVQGALDYDTQGTPFTAPYYGAYTMPFARSEEFTVHELPFVIENGSEPRTITASIEIKRGGGSIELDSVELLRLGDTRLDHRWGQNLPVDPIHGLTKLKAAPKPDQTHFEKFEDTWTGAEVWLVSQGLRSRLQYPGTPNFTHDGKYFYLTTPGYVLRTDGSARFGPFKAERIDSRYLPWPAKWMRDHLPSDRDSSDWMITEYRDNGYGLTNIVTKAKVDIGLPKRDDWRLVKMAPDEPGTYVNADPNLRCLWISRDRKLLAVSDSRGERFRELKPATDSDDPTKDYLNDPFWSIDDKGRWYVSYIMNWLKLHNSFPKTPENSINPGQIWMIPVTPEIGKPVRVIEGLRPGIKRRVLSNGVAVRRAENMGSGHQALSPDRELLLESFQKTSTMAVRSRKTGEVWHFGNFPYLDHPEWVWHRDFGTMRGDLRPLPLFFFDMRHGSMWPIVSMNYHDYGERLQSLRQKRGDATVFFSGQATSPDGTKVAYASPMLSDSRRSKGDVYFAIARYPLPPVDVRVRRPDQAKCSSGNAASSLNSELPEQRRSAPRSGLRLVWSPPRYSREIAGYHVYHSTNGGNGYRRLTNTPVDETHYDVSLDGYYVVTSVEHSGLESRAFSNETSVNGTGPTRIVLEAEFSDFTKPFEPWFDQRTARNAYAVGVLDRDLLFRDKLKSGLVATATQQLLIPKRGDYMVWARVKCRRTEDRGKFHVTVGETNGGHMAVETTAWKWIRSSVKAFPLRSGKVPLQFTTTHTGILVDQFLITDDVGAPEIFPNEPHE